jgi:hypothetical protein
LRKPETHLIFHFKRKSNKFTSKLMQNTSFNQLVSTKIFAKRPNVFQKIKNKLFYKQKSCIFLYFFLQFSCIKESSALKQFSYFATLSMTKHITNTHVSLRLKIKKEATTHCNDSQMIQDLFLISLRT